MSTKAGDHVRYLGHLVARDNAPGREERAIRDGLNTLEVYTVFEVNDDYEDNILLDVGPETDYMHAACLFEKVTKDDGD